MLLTQVILGGGLDKAGIQKGDSLVAVNGERLNSWNALVEKLDNMQADAEATGDKDASVQMVYSRNGLRDTVTVHTDSLFRVGATFLHWLIIKKLPVNMDSLNLFLCRGTIRNKYVEGICERYEICVH